MPQEKPNILFLVLDSFRADKCYGKEKTSLTPNIDNLINNGAYFSQTISSGYSTLLASASILTGYYPFKALSGDRKNLKLFSNTKNYVESLKDFGYNTHAAIPITVDFWGFADHFDEKYVPDFKKLILSKGLGERILQQFDSSEFKEPWFLYVHALDLHELGDLPEQFNDNKFGINQYEKMVSSVDMWIGKILEKINLNETIVIITGDHGSDEGVYTPDMQFVNYENKKPLGLDRKVYEMVSYSFWFKPDISPRLRLFRNFIGKCLRFPQTILKHIRFAQIDRLDIPINQKRVMKHAIADVEEIFDGLIRIPLIFSGFTIPKGIVIEKQTRMIDFFPTIAELISLPKRKEKVHGRSLTPYFQGIDLEELPARIESSPKWFAPVSKDHLGVRTSKYKYFRNRNESTKDVHLFDLENDPFEEKNISKQNPEIIKKMEQILSDLDKDDVSMDELEDMSEDTKTQLEEELKKLGYI